MAISNPHPPTPHHPPSPHAPHYHFYTRYITTNRYHPPRDPPNTLLPLVFYKVGACASPAAGKAMAEYYLSATLKADPGTARPAYYYAGAERRQTRRTASASPRPAPSPSCGAIFRRRSQPVSASPTPGSR